MIFYLNLLKYPENDIEKCSWFNVNKLADYFNLKDKKFSLILFNVLLNKMKVLQISRISKVNENKENKFKWMQENLP